MQAIVEAPGEPVASLDDREGAADCFREAAVYVVKCCIHVNLQSYGCCQPQQKMQAQAGQDQLTLCPRPATSTAASTINLSAPTNHATEIDDAVNATKCARKHRSVITSQA